MMDNKKASILMVEDNENVLMLNQTLLEGEDTAIYTARSLSEARKKIELCPMDILLLDIVLPDGNGFELIPEIREKYDTTILMLTSKRQYNDILNGLVGGADDYMTKPYRADELQARVAALLHKRKSRLDQSKMRYVTFGSLTMDTVSSQVFIDGTNMQLTQKEYALMQILIHNEGKALTSEQLYKEAWGQPMVGDNQPIRTTVSRLRKKLEGSNYTISAARGEGYIFQASALKPD